MNTQTIFYWPSGAWTDDKETAALAVDCLDFPEPESIELDVNADVDSELAGVLPEAETV